MAYLPVSLPSRALIGHVRVRVCWRRGSVRKWKIFSGCVFSNSSALELVSPKLPTPPLIVPLFFSVLQNPFCTSAGSFNLLLPLLPHFSNSKSLCCFQNVLKCLLPVYHGHKNWNYCIFPCEWPCYQIGKKAF